MARATRRLIRREQVVGLVLAAFAASCTNGVVTPSTITPTALPTTTLPSATPTVAAATPTGPVVPPLLVFVASGAGQGLWRVDPGTPAQKTALTAPTGTWQPTAGAKAVALVSVGGSPVQIVLTHLSGNQLVPDHTTTLPPSGAWDGAFVACVSAAGRMAIADAGETLSLLDPASQPRPIAGQRNNLGGCTWLDESELLFDQEAPALMLSAPAPAAAAASSIVGRDPSSGGGRLAWVDRATGGLRVGMFSLATGGLTLGHDIGQVSVGASGSGSLSADGLWLLAVGVVPGAITIYSVTPTGLTEAAIVPLDPGAQVSWLPIT